MTIPPIQGSNLLPKDLFSDRAAAKAENRPAIQINSGNEPLTLLYRTAAAKLNELLKPELGADVIEQASAKPDEFSPEALAGRIVSFATAFLPSYQEHHADLGNDKQLDGFMTLIRDAIEQGFAEAREILDGLGVLQGTVKDSADRTHELIQQQLAAFEQTQRAAAAQA